MMDEVSSQSQFSKEELLNDDLSDDSDNDQENEQPQAISSSESINKIEFEKKYFEATDIITQLRMRLIRRTSMIDEIRKCYLRDVVVLKNVLDEILTGTEKEIIVKEITSRLPSLDLRQSLAVHAPKNTEMRVSPCESCGGRVEAILIDSDEVIQLQKLVSQMKERENRFKLKLAELDAKLEKVTKDKAESGKRHMEEVKFSS